MTRRLLPRFRRAPNPPSIPDLPAGEWSRIAVPADLGKLDYGKQDDEVRSKVQSIPSPWARMLLFKNALETELHPARPLVENELLDGLEFLWSQGQMRGVPVSLHQLRMDEVLGQGRSLSQRAADFTSALVELMPRWTQASEPHGFAALVVATRRDKAVLGSSPFTILFTAEDAAAAVPGELFRYAQGAPRRRLKDRPPAFQRYVARVLLPQLDASFVQNNRDVDWVTTRRLASEWLQREVRDCQEARPELAESLQPPVGADWNGAAQSLGLARLDQEFGGVVLFKKDGGETDTSRWKLHVEREGVAQPPLVVDRPSFDGVFYDGAPRITIPQSDALDRSVLPGLGVQYPWVDPERDWFTDRLLLLEAPLDRSNVFGAIDSVQFFGGLDPSRLILPLRSNVLEFFTPAALARMVSVRVHPGPQLEVSLTLQVGADGEPPRSLTVRKRYDAQRIHQVAGPSLVLWPSFTDARWKEYSLFRYDRSGDAAALFDVVALRRGAPLASDVEQRSPHVQVSSFSEAPEGILVRAAAQGTGVEVEEFGLVLPRFREVVGRTQGSWHVGVDFGTSNTVVTVRPDGQGAPTEFAADDLLLRLTSLNEDESRLLDAYFFPVRIKAGAFGTAVVHFRKLSTYLLRNHGLGVRVNVPFSGYVQPDEKNAVVGDLKWSKEQSTHFLTSSFLRHVMSTIVAHAMEKGVDPDHIKVSWAYPRAFTIAQVNQLRGLWIHVQQEFANRGIQLDVLPEPVDESSAILRHFVDAGTAGVAGQLTVLLDVGGGTSDIAAVASGKALVLDSLMLGGRNLTGPRLQGTTHDRLRNPFVAAFAQWAAANQLDEYPEAQRALTKYLSDGQDHLAFSYLLGTPWFVSNGQRFTGEKVCFQFQALILYFYGALFHYLGITVRDLIARNQIPSGTLPHTVLIAGNGSRYLEWLTDLMPIRGANAFTSLLGKVLARSAIGHSVSSEMPRIELSTKPKREVALGLVARVNPNLYEGDAARTSVVGEAISVPLARGGAQSCGQADRFREEDLIEPDDVPALAWTSNPMEIQRYHETLVELIPSLAAHGAQWNATADSFRRAFSEMKAADLQQATRNRLHFIAMQEDGFRGSIFALEAATVLDLMMQRLFDVQTTPAFGLPAQVGGSR